MANFNKVILMGNLTRDPELSYTANNTAICKFGLAVNRKWKDQSGASREDTCFVDLTAFGRQAETLNQYVTKGNPLLVEGRLNYGQWTNQDGQKRSKLDVVVEGFQFLGGGGGGGGRSEGAGGGGARGGQSAPSGRSRDQDYGPPPSNDDYAPAADGDGDIPF